MRRLVKMLALWAAWPGATAAQEPVSAAASAVVAAGPVRWRGVDLHVEFTTSGPAATFTARLPDGTVVPLQVVTRVSDALAVLADKRLAFAWPALLRWAGEDLTQLRDRVLARARISAATGMVVTVPRGTTEDYAGSASTLVTLQLSTALWDAGLCAEALALLRQRMAALPARPVAGEGGYSEVSFGDRLATWQFEAGNSADALATLNALRADARIDRTIRINADVNTAMALARLGRGKEALAIIDRALSAFRAGSERSNSDNVKVPDSEAQFAWIKACALSGLGRRAEAAATMAGIVADADNSPGGGTPARARVSGYLCARDVPSLAGELARQLVDPAPGAALLLTLQPDNADWETDRATMAAAIRDPRVVAAMARTARLLPPEFAAAVAKWRTVATAGIGSAPTLGENTNARL